MIPWEGAGEDATGAQHLEKGGMLRGHLRGRRDGERHGVVARAGGQARHEGVVGPVGLRGGGGGRELVEGRVRGAGKGVWEEGEWAREV